MLNNFVKLAVQNGGSLHPLIIPSSLTRGTGIMNPSIMNDNGTIKGLIRHVNYTFYHSEAKLFQHPWGPLTYIHPEDDMHLRTENYYFELDDSLDISRLTKIDTSKFDTYEPQWNFVGLEDARLFRWGEKLYTSGVRRDTTPHGEGRMELCEIAVTDNEVAEVSRFRIPPPQDPKSYCEKNWMPVIDMPYHYVKWSNPTEVVKVDPSTKTSSTVSLSELIKLPTDCRGGSQVLTLPNGNRIALTHEVKLFNSEVGRKDGIYRHRFLVWDKDWNIIKTSTDFSFLDAHIEFAVGMCFYKDTDVLISFGFQDNAAFVLKVPLSVIENFIYND
jgi:hypothetical protein